MSAYVASAREWAVEMVRRESRGSGDRDRAMATVARRCGVTPSLIRSLHYRPPKNLVVTAYFAIASAYRDECEKQRKRLEHEIAITAAKVGFDAAVVRAARGLKASGQSIAAIARAMGFSREEIAPVLKPGAGRK